MPHELVIAPSGRLALVERSSPGDADLPEPVARAFAESPPRGLLHLAANELQSRLPPALDHLRAFARTYLTRLCQTQTHEAKELPPTPPPAEAELAAWVLQAPPMPGLEYLRPEALAGWWADLDELVRGEIRGHKGGAQAYLSEKNPQWRFVGRVTFHLAENKRDPDHPFAFLATYVSRLSAGGQPQHEPLGRALQQYAGEKNKPALLSLLVPIQRASERSTFVKGLVDSGDVYHALAWSPGEAYRFLKDVPVFEESGLLVRIPDWWKPNHPPRATVSVKIDGKKASKLGVGALLEFSVGAALDGEPLTDAEVEELLASAGGLVRLKGKWVEVDRDRLAEALDHWKKVEREVSESGLSFFEGMRLLSGAALPRDAAEALPEADREWTGLTAGPELKGLLARLESPESRQVAAPAGLRAELRPYQRTGLGWLHFLARLGLGACLADDMGLGKTVQVIALLLALKEEGDPSGSPLPRFGGEGLGVRGRGALPATGPPPPPPPPPPGPSPPKRGRGEDRPRPRPACWSCRRR
jgi:non-specific serine/threonine protein kinase